MNLLQPSFPVIKYDFQSLLVCFWSKILLFNRSLAQKDTVFTDSLDSSIFIDTVLKDNEWLAAHFPPKSNSEFEN